LATVLCAGLIAVDHVFFSERSVGRVGSVEYLGTSGGGSVGNAAAMLSLLGHSPGVTGVVGNDGVANLVRADFSKLGVDASRLIVRSGIRRGIRTRQFSHLIYRDGRHSFRDQCLQCGNPFDKELGLLASNLDRDLKASVARCNALHLDRANGFTVKLAEEAQAKGLSVTFDLVFRPYGRGEGATERLLSMANLVKVSEELFKNMTESSGAEGLRKWKDKFPNTSHLFVTRGDKGVFGYCQVRNERPTFDLPAIPPKPLRDGGGAGDILVASLIDQFVLGSGAQDEEEARARINKAQALASLGCTLFGARSLAHVLRAQAASPTDIWRMAQEITQSGVAVSNWSSKVGIPWRSPLGFLFGTNHACNVCGTVRSKKGEKRPKSRRLEYHVSLGQAPGAMSESYKIGEAYRAALKGIRERPTVFVGSGGSLSAATFGEYMVWHQFGKPSRAFPPYEFVGLPKLDREIVVWLLSYGGANPDIIAAAERVRELKVKDCVVLTGAKKSQLAQMAKEWKWNLVVLPGQERSFVATVGMLAMVSAIASILSNGEERVRLDASLDYPNLLDAFVNNDRLVRDKVALFPDDMKAAHVIGLSSGWGWPALVDFESKLVEGGLCTIEITELKNFTHGRYIGALQRRKTNKLVILKTPENGELSEFIERKLRRHMGTVMLSTELQGPAGGLDLMLKVLFLSAHLAKKVGRDISNPEYPPEARGLYGWMPSERISADEDQRNGSGKDE